MSKKTTIINVIFSAKRLSCSKEYIVRASLGPEECPTMYTTNLVQEGDKRFLNIDGFFGWLKQLDNHSIRMMQRRIAGKVCLLDTCIGVDYSANKCVNCNCCVFNGLDEKKLFEEVSTWTQKH